MARHFKTFFVVNPKAGHGRGKKIWGEIEREIALKWGHCDFEYTDSQGHGIILSTEALRSGYEMVVAVGGDGTGNEVLNGFFEDGVAVNEEAVMGIIPAGTAGDFVRSMNYPKSLSDRIGMLMGRETRKIDIGHVAYKSPDGMSLGRYYLNVAGCGLAGEVVDEISKVTRSFGSKAAYLIGLVKALKHHKNALMSVRIDGSEPISKRAICAVVANGQYFGSGMRVAPDAIVDDGWFDFVLIGDIGVSELIRNLPKLYQGNLRNHPNVEVYRAREVEIKSDERVLLDLDGEQQGVLPATYTIVPKALRLKA